jgi:plasmid stability protein
MKHLTIRNCPSELDTALQTETRRRGQSLNQTVIQLLSQALGVASHKQNGLQRFAGGWSEEEFAEFERANASSSMLDPEIWQ